MDSDYDFPKISEVGPVGSPCLVFQRDQKRPISKSCLAHEARSYSLGNPGTGGSTGGPGNLHVTFPKMECITVWVCLKMGYTPNEIAI